MLQTPYWTVQMRLCFPLKLLLVSIETVTAMARVIEGAEAPAGQRSKHRIDETIERIDESLALSAMYAANHLKGVKAVICMTETGFTPLLMSRITSSLPIYAFAEKAGTCEITALYERSAGAF